MSEERVIELDVDAVFPPPGSRSGLIRKPPTREKKQTSSRPPLRTLPPPPPLPGAHKAMERLQEDVDLVIEATSRRLDRMAFRQEEFERTIRGVLGAQERRIRETELELERTRAALRDVSRLNAELVADVSRCETRQHELHARNAVALARVEAVERASYERGPSSLAELALDLGVGDEATQKIVRS